MGQGQWAAAKHGAKGIRAWRKLHVGVDANGAIVAEQLTDSTVDDSTVVEGLLDQVETWSWDRACAPRWQFMHGRMTD